MVSEERMKLTANDDEEDENYKEDTEFSSLKQVILVQILKV